MSFIESDVSAAAREAIFNESKLIKAVMATRATLYGGKTAQTIS
jgi:hypothetical protein